jgi:hypothetical protein
LPEAKKSAPPIIERTCAFDAKIYKNVDGFFDVSACGGGNKKKFKFPIFVFNYHRFWSKNAVKIVISQTHEIGKAAISRGK